MSVQDWLHKPPPAAPTPAPGLVTDSPEKSSPPPPTPKPDRGTVLRGMEAPAAPEGTAAPIGPLPRFRIGDQIAGTYLVKAIIHGGMATVYVTHHERWKIDLVVKVPQDEILRSPEHRHRIFTEAEAWTALGMHRHIAHCHFVLPLNDVPLLIIEYLDGGNLRDWIADGRCADLRVGLDLAIQACHGLEHAHAKGLIHRDIKPENILLSKDGTLKITDFGIARIADRPVDMGTPDHQAVVPGRTRGGMGTDEYMAPEQFVSAHDVDARADLFSLGVCLYEMLCGQRPYGKAVGPRQEAPAPQTFRSDSDLPNALCALLQQCVDWNPARRPASARDLRLELCRIYEVCFQQPSPWAALPEVSLEADGWNNRGVNSLELDQQEEALRCFTQALQANPTHLEATFNQGLLQWRRGEIDDLEVLRRLDQCATLGVDTKALALAKAEIHQERYAPDAARQTLASYDGAYEAHFGPGESSRICLLQILMGHTDRITWVSISDDGRMGLSASADETLKLWDLTTGRCLRTIKSSAGSLLSAAIPPHALRWTIAPHVVWKINGETLSKKRRLWNQEEDQEPQTAELRLAEISSIGISPDGDRLLAGYRDGSLELLDLSMEEIVIALQGHSDVIASVALSEDGRLGLSGSADKTLKLWNFETGQCLRTIEGHWGEITSVAITPNGGRGLSGSADKTLRLWDLTTGQCLRTLTGHADSVTSVALTPDASWALSGSSDTTLRLWSLETGSCTRVLEGHADSVVSVAISSDGSRGLSGADWTFRVWDLATGQCLHILRGHSSPTSVAITSDGSLGLSATEGRAVSAFRESEERVRGVETNLWDLADGQCIKTLEGGSETVGPVAITHDGCRALLAIGTMATYWDLDVGKCLHDLGRGSFLEPITSVALTPSGARGLLGSTDKTLTFWDLETGNFLRTLKGHSGRITSVALTADGHHGISGSADNTLKLWDLSAGQCLRTFDGHSAVVTSVALTPDGRYGLSGSRDKTLKYWDLRTGQCLRTLGGHSEILSVALTPDGHRALSGSWDKTLMLWDLTTGRCLRVIKEDHEVLSVALTPDGRRALSGSWTLKLWDLETGNFLRSLEGHSNWITSVALASDGQRALSGSRDWTVKLWNWSTGQCIRTLIGDYPVPALAAISQDGRVAISASGILCKGWDLKADDLFLQRVREEGGAFWPEDIEVTSAAISPDCQTGLTGTVEAELQVWDLVSGELRMTCGGPGHSEEITSLALTGDGKRGLSGSQDRTLKWWDLNTGECLRTIKGHVGRITSVAMTSDGRRALVAGDECSVKFWDLGSGQWLRTLGGHSETVTSIALTVDGLNGLSGSADKTLRFWDLTTGQCLRTIEGHAGAVMAVAITPDGRWALSGSEDHEVRMWDLDKARGRRQSFKFCQPRSYSLIRAEHDAHQEQLDIMDNDGIAALYINRKRPEAFESLVALWQRIGFRWDDRIDSLYAALRSVGVIGGFLVGVPQIIADAGECASVALDADGRVGLSAGDDGILRLWDPMTGQCLRTMKGHSGPVTSVAIAITQKRKMAISGGRDGVVRLWDLPTGECLKTLRGHPSGVRSVAISSDGCWAVSGGHDSTLRFWDLTTGQCLLSMSGHTRRITSVALTADGRWGLSSSADKNLKYWDLATGECLHTLEGPSDSVASVALAANGCHGLSGGVDKTLNYWDLETGRCVRTLHEHNDAITSVAMTADGRHGLSGSSDGTLRIWDLEAGRVQQTYCSPSPITAVAMTGDGCRALVASGDGALVYWRLIWRLEFP